MQKTYPLTKEQERLWLEWKLRPLGHAYNTNIQFKLVGPLDVQRFKDALKVITSNFAAFRTHFGEMRGVPYQVINDTNEIPLEYVDLTTEGYDPAVIEAQAENIVTERLRAPFNLYSMPLTRFCLVKLAHDTHYFIYVMPHIILDGHSAKLFLKSLSELYNAQGDDLNACVIPEEKGDIGEYLNHVAVQQSELWQGEAKQYWKEILQSTPLHLDLNCGKSLQGITRKGRRTHFSISADTYKNLKALAKKERTTVFGVLASIFGIFLYRHFDQKIFAISYPVDLRPVEFKSLFGFAVNNLPLKMGFDSLVTASDIIQKTTEQRRLGRRYEELPLKDILRSAREETKVTHSNALNVVFAEATFSLQGLQLKDIEVYPRTCNYAEVISDLALFYDGTADTLELAWDYKEGIFDSEFIQQACQSFVVLVESVISHPSQPVDKLSLLSSVQVTERLAFYKACSPEHSATPKTLHQLFEERVVAEPTATALIYKGDALTYNALNLQAEYLARELENKGIGPNSRVALCMERSLEWVVSILAILKVGATYIPLDIAAPSKRLEWLVRDSMAQIILAKEDAVPLLENITIPTYSIKLADQSELGCVLTRRHIPDDTAYIIYTSGSTGTPKGVMVTHKNAVDRIMWFQQVFPLHVNERALQNMNLCFDPSIHEIFHPLSMGATLVISEKSASSQPRSLIAIINHYQISMASFVPSFLKILLPVLKEGDCESLKYVTSGGEALPAAVVTGFYQKLRAKLYNLYGPTEATILATCHYCDPNSELSVVPIGKPLNNTPIYIMDQHGQFQPPGAVGELYIGGIGVASGYLNEPALTKERFVEDSFSGHIEGRLFKTRDLGRYLPDGSIEYLGRIDNQVKIRGYRIELGEIETTILQSGLVNDVAVVVHENAHGKQLIAYYVSTDNRMSSEIRSTLAKTLPDYMIPAAFVSRESLPCTPNGKIDREFLEGCAVTASAHREGQVAPRNPTESKIAKIWADILECDESRIGIKDRFWDIGGDSLMSIRLCCEIELAFQMDIPDSCAYELPTIEDWARYILAESNKVDTQSIAKARAKQRQQAMAVRNPKHLEKQYG